VGGGNSHVACFTLFCTFKGQNVPVDVLDPVAGSPVTAAELIALSTEVWLESRDYFQARECRLFQFTLLYLGVPGELTYVTFFFRCLLLVFTSGLARVHLSLQHGGRAGEG
jgi:hypothetical protein